MDISLFDFELPEELIAQFPIERRDESRLMVIHRKSGKIIHSVFKNIINFLSKDTLVILNNSRVIKSRLLGLRNGKGRCEVFLHKIISPTEFLAFLKPHNKFKVGDRVVLSEYGYELEIVEIDRENFANRVRVLFGPSIYQVMEDAGHIPLPPYIKRPDIRGLDDRRYQTIYADSKGSIAAPTAGLHFTEEVLSSFDSVNITYDFITLYVGIGTFAPVRVQDISEHKMHMEEYEISKKTAGRINSHLLNKKNILAVGTTTVRTLESNYLLNKMITPGRFSTEIFIYPGFEFNVTDMMITNFHLPRSTLFMLVCAFAGRELMLYSYQEAIKNQYRFFSYGDAMLII